MFCSGIIVAQDKPSFDLLKDMSLEDLLTLKISISSTEKTNIFNSPSTVSIIDRQMLDLYNFNDIGDAINVISGINLGRTTSRQQLPTIRGILQDHYPNKVLVLINGIPQWNSVTGECGPLNRVSINDVEKIEILKGPASVLYGSNAYTGAINIVLKNESDKTQGSIRGAIGTAKNFNSCASYNFTKNDFGFYISFNSQKEQGDKRTIVDEKNVKGSYYDFIDYSNLTASVRYKNHELTFNGYNESQQKLGVDPNFEKALGKPQVLNGYLISYNSNLLINNKIKWITQISNDLQEKYFPLTQNLSQYTNTCGNRTFGSTKLFYETNKRFNSEVGFSCDYRKSLYYTNIDLFKDSVLSEHDLKNKSITEVAGFAQIQYNYGIFKLLAGDRFTVNNYFGNDNSTRATLLMSLNKLNTIKFIYGQSYRAPSLLETFFVNSKKSLGGNPHLKPETSTSYEITYLTSFKKCIIQASVYYAEYNNKIFRTDNPYPLLPDGSIGTANAKQYTNGHMFSATGLEIEGKYQGKKVNAFMSYNYIVGSKGDTIGTGNMYHYNFKYIPQHTVNAGLAYLLKKWRFSALINYISSTQGGLVIDGKSQMIPDWIKFDFNASYNHLIGNYKVRHVISIKNIFNNTYYVPEYVDRTLNSIPTGIGRRLNYTIVLVF